MSSFQDMFLEYTAEAESPESFFLWSAYTGIAAVLRDNVWVDLGLKKVWPNIYTILLARSAALRKSVPLQVISSMIMKTGGVRVIKGRSSIQAVIKELGSIETTKDGHVPPAGASGILISEELASFAPDDPATIPLLTDLYDNHEQWSSNLVSTGKTGLKNTCVSLLAASNEAFFKEVYTALAIRGGLLGRTFIVREEKKRKSNSLMYTQFTDNKERQDYLKKRYDPTLVIQRLKAVAQLRGEIDIDFDARQDYEKWYDSIEKMRIGDTGVTERIHTGILKVALLICAGETKDMIIRRCHINEAIDRCVSLLKNYEIITMSAGKADNVDAVAMFLAYLWEHSGWESHQTVMRDNWMHFDLEVLGKIVATLETAGLVRQEVRRNVAGYALTEKGREYFQKGDPK